MMYGRVYEANYFYISKRSVSVFCCASPGSVVRSVYCYTDLTTDYYHCQTCSHLNIVTHKFISVYVLIGCR